MSLTHVQLFTHVVFPTQSLRPWIDVSLKIPLYAQLSAAAQECSASALGINGPADHVHLLLSSKSEYSLDFVLQLAKDTSAQWVRDNHPGKSDFDWQEGYAAFSVSASNCKAVLEFIEKQEERHKRMTYAEEYRILLGKHGMSIHD